MAELGLAVLLAIVGFLLVVLGKQVVQFVGIVLMVLSIGGAVTADLRK